MEKNNLPPWAEEIHRNANHIECHFFNFNAEEPELAKQILKLLHALDLAMGALKLYSDNDYARVAADEARKVITQIEKLGVKE